MERTALISAGGKLYVNQQGKVLKQNYIFGNGLSQTYITTKNLVVDPTAPFTLLYWQNFRGGNVSHPVFQFTSNGSIYGGVTYDQGGFNVAEAEYQGSVDSQSGYILYNFRLSPERNFYAVTYDGSASHLMVRINDAVGQYQRTVPAGAGAIDFGIAYRYSRSRVPHHRACSHFEAQ